MAEIHHGHRGSDIDFQREHTGHLEDETTQWGQPTLALRPGAGSMKVVGGRRDAEAIAAGGGNSGAPLVAKTRTTVGVRDRGQFSHEHAGETWKMAKAKSTPLGG